METAMDRHESREDFERKLVTQSITLNLDRLQRVLKTLASGSGASQEVRSAASLEREGLLRSLNVLKTMAERRGLTDCVERITRSLEKDSCFSGKV